MLIVAVVTFRSVYSTLEWNAAVDVPNKEMIIPILCVIFYDVKSESNRSFALSPVWVVLDLLVFQSEEPRFFIRDEDLVA